MEYTLKTTITLIVGTPEGVPLILGNPMSTVLGVVQPAYRNLGAGAEVKLA